ncbi:MAG: hypothetical protein ACN4GW_04015 [Desulforhopalus sp.]
MTKQKIRKDKSLQVDADELKRRQSVRTTFKLPEKTINLLKVSAKHLGIKQKTLLDQLIEDEKILNLLAEEAHSHNRKDEDCRPKTFVISKKALDLIDTVSNSYAVPRAFLVELSIERLSSYIEALSETHEIRRTLLKEIDKYQKFLEELLNKTKAKLEQEDPLRMKLERLTNTTQRSIGDIRKTVKDKQEFIY